jgi:hypothetical protein
MQDIKKSILSAVVTFSIFCLLFSTMDSNAQTFRIDGPKTYNLTRSAANPGLNIIVKNLTAVDQKIYVHIENNAENQLEYYPNPIELPDSNHTQGAELVLIYTAHGPSIINAQVIFYDSVSTRDTVYINGRDSLYHDALNPFRIYDADGKELRGTQTSLSRSITFKHHEGTRQLPFTIRNYSPASLVMNIMISSTSNGFSVSPATITLDPYPSASMSSVSRVTYTSTDNHFDTAVFIIKSDIPGSRIDTFLIIAEDSLYKPKPIFRGDTIDFRTQLPGSETWVTVPLVNPNKQPIAIMELQKDSGNTSGFGISVMHSFPFNIAAQKKDSFLLTYTAPYEQGVNSHAGVSFKYLVGGETQYFRFTFLGKTAACYPMEPAGILTLESVIPGGYTDASFSITNNSTDPLTIDSINLGLGNAGLYFSVNSPSLPAVVQAGDKQHIGIRFAPTDYVPGMATSPVTINLSSANIDQYLCKQLVYTLASETISADDTSRIPLYPNQTASLPMTSKTDTLTKRFTFINNLSIPIRVVSVAVGSGTHFRITSTDPAMLPVILQPNDVFTIDVLFDAGMNGYYTDDLIIVTDQSLSAQTYRLKALRTEGQTESVEQDGSINAVLNVFPNPATSGTISIKAPQGTKKISIFDALGRFITESKNTTEWIWKAVHQDRTGITTGVYFVRAEGLESNGRPFVISKRVIFER